jgi:hypothetical protein
MIPLEAPSLYGRHYLDRQDDRLDQFRILAERFGVRTALYPGSFVHITPSLCFPEVVYVDTDGRAEAFFRNAEIQAYVSKHKIFDGKPTIRFHAVDYRRGFDEPRQYFDLLISQHAGFVSLYCGDYLRPGGFLLANNSHGDASMASIDERYELIGVLRRRGQRFSFSDKGLDAYFVPKKPVEITREYLLARRRGIGYTRSATSYVFRTPPRAP